ncbi:MAG: corrinoid protein [Phycisphaerae bacterium]|jgi:5-methyltetrahydrofolate--homocysteine methyltransferase
MADLQLIADSIIKGDMAAVVKGTNEALEEGISAEKLLNEGLVAGMAVVGERFRNNDIFIPEVLIAARAMKAAMELLEPILAETGVQPKATVVIGTVQGDLHDIGKNLVGMMLKGAGFKIVDIGVNCTPEMYVEAAKQHNPELVGMSALLTTTMPAMERIIKALREQGVSSKVMIGGAPVTQNYADHIGADGYSEDAASAVILANKLLQAC